MNKDVKEWIKGLDDRDFFSLVRETKTGLEGLGEEREHIIKEEIRRFIPEKRRTGKSPLSVNLLRFGVAASIVFILSIFLVFTITELNRISAIPVITSGTILVKKDNVSIEMPEKASYREGETIITGVSSSCTLHIGGAMVRLNEETINTLRTLSKEQVYVLLEYGEILLNTGSFNGKKGFTCATPNTITHFGSIALVRYIKNSTYIALYKGEAEIQTEGIGDSKEIIRLEEGEDILIADGESPVRGRFSDEIGRSLQRFTAMAHVPEPAKGVKVRIDVHETEVSLFIDNTYIHAFDDTITLFLAPADHVIRLEKEGFLPFEKAETFKARGSYSIEAVLQKGPPGDETGDRESGKRKLGSVRELYTYRNKDNPEQSMILGFAGSDNRIVAVTRTQLTCFDRKGNKVWEHAFDSAERIVFDSIPYVYGDTLYVPALYKLLMVNINTGIYDELQAPGMISDGFGMAMYNDVLYMPYPDGIYAFNTKGKPKIPEAFIMFQNPVKPLVTANGLYLSSFIVPETALYSFDGQLKKRHEIAALSVCPPIETGGYIITGDYSGTITRFTQDLRKTASVKIGSGIVALLEGNGTSFFALALSGNLYHISLNDLSILGKITIDKTSDSGIYLFKHPVRIENDILLGTGGGDICVIDCDTFTVRERKKICDEPVSCAVFITDDACFTGTKNGTIFLLEFKE
jgi:hypothetical protein